MSDQYKNKKAILHIDGDAFFASCEQSTNVSLRNKPIAVGRERGVATAYSYEAKALGVTRGLNIKDLKRDFPSVLLVSSDYRKYSLFSSRMKSIVGEFASIIEKTSIDECYADITGLDVEFECSYEEVARKIQTRLGIALGMTFSIGLAPTKILAKIGSNCNKPHGITVITDQYLKDHLYNLPIGYVPGVGYRTEPKMNNFGIYTIGDFVSKDVRWIKDFLSKPYENIHKELSGSSVLTFEVDKKSPKSISKVHAFSELSNDINFLQSELSRHSEVIAKKLRREKLGATRIRCGLKTFQEFIVSDEYHLDSPTHDPQVIFSIAKEMLDTIRIENKKYRATYLSVSGLQKPIEQISLFQEQDKKKEGMEDVLKILDGIDIKYGAGTITRALSQRKKINILEDTGLIKSKDSTKILYMPYLGTVS